MGENIKIGELAKILGVTPDFLKHYENYDIIRPKVSESGYRYYDFVDIVLIQESMKLKWWGYSIKDMKQIMMSNNVSEYLDHLQPFVNTKNTQKTLIEMMVYDHECNRRRFEKELNQWFIHSKWPCYFIPQAINKQMIENEELQNSVHKWQAYLPITRQAAIKKVDHGILDSDTTWGFFSPIVVYDGLDLTLCGQELELLTTRFFEMNVCLEFDVEDAETALTGLFERALQTMQHHNLIADGYAVFDVHFDLTDSHHHTQYGVIRIPVQ